MKLTKVRAKEIMEQAREKAIHGPWVDQLDKVMTKEEREEVILHWEAMPGNTSFYDAFMRFVRGSVDPLPTMNAVRLTFYCNETDYKDSRDEHWTSVHPTFQPKGDEQFRASKKIHGSSRYVWWSPTEQCYYAQISPYNDW